MPRPRKTNVQAGRNSEVAPDVAADLAPVVGKNLRQLRSDRKWSLEKLAQESGVSRAMLGQIELGQSAPTINVLWKIARAIDVPFSALITTTPTSGPRILRANSAKKLMSHDGSFASRALFPFDAARRVEFYELTLTAHGIERADAHAPGTTENLVVAKGVVDIELAGATHHLEAGDAILFDADLPHAYKNASASDAVMYLVMTYSSPR